MNIGFNSKLVRLKVAMMIAMIVYLNTGFNSKLVRLKEEHLDQTQFLFQRFNSKLVRLKVPVVLRNNHESFVSIPNWFD